MNDTSKSLGDEFPAIVALTILGGGLMALFLGYSWFWMVFALGFAVVLPLLTILWNSVSGRRKRRWKRYDEPRDEERTVESEHRDEKQDALDTLRDRYACGEIDEAEFERRADLLLETETVDDLKARRERELN